VRLGAYDFTDDVDPVAKDYEIANFKIHGEYDSISHTNDIAIVTLRTEAELDLVRPICLPPVRRTFFGQIATVVGWGTIEYGNNTKCSCICLTYLMVYYHLINEGGAPASKLREVSLPIWNNTDCSQAYSRNFPAEILCAGYHEGGRDTCQGDSGGPLMLQGANRRWMLVGIVSWGYRCGEPDFPGVYTRVNHYLTWIENNLGSKREPASIISPNVAPPSIPPSNPIVLPQDVSSDLTKIRNELSSLEYKLEIFIAKAHDGKEIAQRYLKKVRALKAQPSIELKDLEFLKRKVKNYITPPNWFLKQTQICLQWYPDGDKGNINLIDNYKNVDTNCVRF